MMRYCNLLPRCPANPNSFTGEKVNVDKNILRGKILGYIIMIDITQESKECCDEITSESKRYVSEI